MDKKRRTKYQIAVYGIVGALGIIFVFISLAFNWQAVWQSIWINLGTGLIGVVVLFFLVDRFFLADEWGLSDRIDQLIRRFEVSDRPSAEAFFTEFPELDKYLKNGRGDRFLRRDFGRHHQQESLQHSRTSAERGVHAVAHCRSRLACPGDGGTAQQDTC